MNHQAHCSASVAVPCSSSSGDPIAGRRNVTPPQKCRGDAHVSGACCSYTSDRSGPRVFSRPRAGAYVCGLRMAILNRQTVGSACTDLMTLHRLRRFHAPMRPSATAPTFTRGTTTTMMFLGMLRSGDAVVIAGRRTDQFALTNANAFYQ